MGRVDAEVGQLDFDRRQCFQILFGKERQRIVGKVVALVGIELRHKVLQLVANHKEDILLEKGQFTSQTRVGERRIDPSGIGQRSRNKGLRRWCFFLFWNNFSLTLLFCLPYRFLPKTYLYSIVVFHHFYIGL